MRKRKRKELPPPKLPSKSRYFLPFRFKILVLGGPGVGKTTFEATYGSRGFYTDYRSTIGASFRVFNMDVDIARVKLLFWVISANESFRFITRSFLTNAVGAILLYDITNASSIARLPYWLDMLSEQYDELPMVLAGNKVDLADQRAISREEGLALQRERNLTSFTEISLKTGKGVNEVLKFLRDLNLIKYLLDEW